MADTHEIIADIITEMRRRSDEAYKGSFNYPECQENQIEYDEASEWADRLEAAHRRGDAAKLREALMQIYERVNSLDENCAVDHVEIRDIARAALAAPARNCDIVPIEAPKASDMFHRERPLHGYDYETHDWLLAPATEKEGGAK